MSFMDKLKSGLDRAQHEINDFAESTKLKMELGKLQTHKTELFAKIGEQVYALHVKGQAPADVTAACKEVDDLESQIKVKAEQIAKVGAAAAAAAAAPAAPPADPPKPA